MTDLYNFRGTEKDGSSKGPVYILDDEGTKLDIPSGITNNWLLAAELYITGGGVFYCKGISAEGDCNQLRIQSTNSTDFHEVKKCPILLSPRPSVLFRPCFRVKQLVRLDA